MQHLTTPSSIRPILTAHAAKRSQQRGIRRAHQEAVFTYGDVERAVGRGCYRLSISQRRLMGLIREGAITAQIADRCRKLAVITDGASIVTNYKTSM